MAPVFTSIDLFSGMGGNAFALRNIASAALYCEIDPAAVAILTRAMDAGFIPAAPVHDDVCTVRASEAYARALRCRPLLVCGSWPCQGASTMGKRKGMDDPRSGLLRDLCAIVADAAPEVAVFENVPGVLENGSADFMREQLGAAYDIRHDLVCASDFGFPHRRERVFFVLVRRGARLPTTRFAKLEPVSSYAYDASREPVRTVRHRGDMWEATLGALGNSIVPACMYAAVLRLLAGAVVAKRPARDKALVLEPDAFVPRAGFEEDLSRARGPIVRALWATPRASCVRACNVLNSRTSRDLPTMVRFERDTPADARGDSLNPDWVRHLMGFPEGYIAGPVRPRTPRAVPGADLRFTCGGERFEVHSAVVRARAPGLFAILGAKRVAGVSARVMSHVLHVVYYDGAPSGIPPADRKRVDETAAIFGVVRGVHSTTKT